MMFLMNTTLALALMLQGETAQKHSSQAAEVHLPFVRGMSAYQKGDYAAAIPLLEEFVDSVPSSNPKISEAMAALGMSYYLEGRFGQARPLLEKSLAQAPSNPDLAYALGMTHLRDRNSDAARKAFARLYQVAPDSASASLLTAKLMIGAQMEELAKLELERALAIDANLPQLHFLLGELAIFRGDLATGVTELKREIALNPGYFMAYYRLGDALSRQRLLDEAEAPLKKAIWLNPDFSSPYILLGKIYEQKGQLELAEGVLQKAVSMDPNNAGTRYLLGTVYRKMGRLAEAKRELETSTRLKK
jgi:tetratricopeptide (TPR) repeat protein